MGFGRHREIGVNIEYVTPFREMEMIVDRHFSASEKTKIHALSDYKKLNSLYRYWTYSEAYLKSIGEGIAFPLENLDVSFDNDEGMDCPATIGTVFDRACSKTIISLIPVINYVGALAV